MKDDIDKLLELEDADKKIESVIRRVKEKQRKRQRSNAYIEKLKNKHVSI